MASDPGRRLVLLRHAKSAWPEDVADHDRPLAGRGRRDAPAVGRWLRESGYVPDLVLCSTARRARETWQLAEEKLGSKPRTTLERRVYGAGPSELLDLARQTPADVRTLMIVGHEPTMRDLTLELAGTEPGEDGGRALERVRDKFPTAAIAVLDFRGDWAGLAPGQARLEEFAVPSDLRPGHKSSKD
jgi:phosphohistidine phosphatase